VHTQVRDVVIPALERIERKLPDAGGPVV
jgi:hypothetical protein